LFSSLLGAALNWATLEGIVDAADIAYRRRFLLEKYPHLPESDTFGAGDEAGADPQDGDERISVIHEIAQAGGPDLA
jgi:hypothetical protein